MTSTFFTGDEVDQGIELDPDVPFPPFPIWLRIPGVEGAAVGGRRGQSEAPCGAGHRATLTK